MYISALVDPEDGDLPPIPAATAAAAAAADRETDRRDRQTEEQRRSRRDEERRKRREKKKLEKRIMAGGKKKKKHGAPSLARPSTASHIASSAENGSNEIDAIFSRCKKPPVPDMPSSAEVTLSNQKKRKEQSIEEDEEREGEGEGEGNQIVKRPEKKKKKKTKSQETTGLSQMSPKKPRRKTEDGFSVYTEEDLGWNKKNAGGTNLCPFDCDCCF